MFTEFTENDLNLYFNEDEKDENNLNFLNDLNDFNNFNDFDPIFRSIGLNDNNLSILQPLQHSQHSQTYQYSNYSQSNNNTILPPQLKKDYNYENINSMTLNSNLNNNKYDIIIENSPTVSNISTNTTNSNTNNNTPNNTNNINVPDKPFHIGPAQFITTLCLAQIISQINQQLEQFFELSYNFFPDHCRVIFFLFSFYIFCFFLLI